MFGWLWVGVLEVGLVFWWPDWCLGGFFVVVGGCSGACGGGVVVAAGLLERQI